MLLYAKTAETSTPDADFKISGNTISIRNLVLYRDFKFIAKQLDRIVESTFEEATYKNSKTSRKQVCFNIEMI